ncbi:thioredoxin [Nitzschia inconspicua]|uniref:Thioredoxin n=1 Tax=Nitzschia inconspicua TaxID=303405 RepID=A0A9K3KJV7_9STRA|nr:thioredoxin [Nitzschia inconspicua]
MGTPVTSSDEANDEQQQEQQEHTMMMGNSSKIVQEKESIYNNNNNNNNNNHNNNNIIETVTIHHADELDIILHNNHKNHQQQQQQQQPTIAIVVAYKESCPVSMEFLWRFHYAIEQLQQQRDPIFISSVLQQQQQPLLWIQLPITTPTISALERFSISVVPSLVFLKIRNNTSSSSSSSSIHTNLMRYMGPTSTVDDIYHGLKHYLTRLRYSSNHDGDDGGDGGDNNNNNIIIASTSSMMILPVQSIDELQTILFQQQQQQQQQFFFYRPPIPLDPRFSKEETQWIRYLMNDSTKSGDDDNNNNNNDDDDDNKNEIMADPYHVICQCRSQPVVLDDDASNPDNTISLLSYTEFDKVATVLAPRRDTLFCYLQQEHQQQQCTGLTNANGSTETSFDDGTVIVFAVDSTTSTNPNQWTLIQKAIFVPTVPTTSTSQDSAVITTTTTEEDDDDDQDQPTTGTAKDTTTSITTALTGIKEFVTDQLLPTVLWMDRQLTAPLAFAPRYRHHAILVVDFHDINSQTIMQTAVQSFRTACQKQRKRLLLDSNNNNNNNTPTTPPMVCLVVPSTETRILTTFGIDIWTPQDLQFTQWLNNNNNDTLSCRQDPSTSTTTDTTTKRPCNNNNKKHHANDDDDAKTIFSDEVLPTIFVTHRRLDGTGIQRFYLHPPASRQEHDISKFFDSILNDGTAIPEIMSSSSSTTTTTTTTSHSTIKTKKRQQQQQQQQQPQRHDFPTNRHGIHLLTGRSLPQFLTRYRHHHVLLLLYAPTCGHCKRFNVVYNALGDLLRHIGWDDDTVEKETDDNDTNFSHTSTDDNNNVAAAATAATSAAIKLARIDVSSNEYFVRGLTDVNWLPGLLYFGLGATEYPINYYRTEWADTVQLGSINDPLDLVEWWMDQVPKHIPNNNHDDDNNDDDDDDNVAHEKALLQKLLLSSTNVDDESK